MTTDKESAVTKRMQIIGAFCGLMLLIIFIDGTVSLAVGRGPGAPEFALLGVLILGLFAGGAWIVAAKD